MMDCIYKINKYKMSLLIIMSHTALGINFYIAFAFLKKKKKKDFVWILEMLKALYKHIGLKNSKVIVIDRDLAFMNVIETIFETIVNLLYIWHINMNVLKNCKSTFDTEETWKKFYNAWEKIVQIDFEDDFNIVWKVLKQQYRNTHMKKINYLKDTWLTHHRHRFCKVWTNLNTHFDILTISRVEDDHRVLKSILNIFIEDLLTIVDDIELFLNRQYETYTHKFAQKKIKVVYKLPRDLMRDLIDRVSSHALSKIYNQYKLMKLTDKESRNLKECVRTFVIIMSLFCSHMIKEVLKDEEKKLLLEDVHSHWRFKKSEFFRLTFTNDFFFDSQSESSELSKRSFYESSPKIFDDFVTDSLSDVDELIRTRLDSSIVSSISENNDLNDLLDIAEFEIAKAKGRSRESQNKKKIMTRAKKKAAKSTKRDLSEFEHVKREYETRVKRAKKNINGQIKKNITSQIKKDRDRDEVNREERSRDEECRVVTTTISQSTTSMITRADAKISKFMKLFSNIEFNDDEAKRWECERQIEIKYHAFAVCE